MVIGGIVAGDPHIALGIHVNAVFLLRPIVTLAGATPAAHGVAVGVIFDHRRR